MPEKTDPQPGINSWLEEELYQTWQHDRKYVDDSWKQVFETNGHTTETNGHSTVAPTAPNGSNGHAAPAAPSGAASKLTAPPVPVGPNDELVPMRGIAAKIAENMAVSLTMPTATSQRMIPVRVLDENRQLINEQRALTGKSKISYTHLIGWALIRAVDEYRQMNDAYTEQNGDPVRIVRKAVNFGLAVDVKGKDGNSTLMVPNIKGANAMSFTQFLAAFDDVVARARTAKLMPNDFAATTISLTNPGTVGTYGSVPRLMSGQGAIIATGAMDYPAGYSQVSPEMRASLGITKVMMMTCTYDHRIIQGAQSGRFLTRVHGLLNGELGFYERIFQELGLSLKPVRWEEPFGSSTSALPAVAAPAALQLGDPLKEAAVAHLLNAYRVRGHTIANLDPLGSTRPMHPDLDPSTHGLTMWDLDRRVISQGGKLLREVLEDLRQTYSASIAPEYMYIPFPDQKNWIRDRMESTRNQWPLETGTRTRILSRLLEAEHFEQFLGTRFIGKKRFSVEGGESAMVAMDEILQRAGAAGVNDIVIGMAHRGRLNMLANIVGKPLHQLFAEFEEAADSSANRYGTGDVKYHLGAEAVRKTESGKEVTVSVAFNPSHLEAVNPVVEGIARAKQDKAGDKERRKSIPVLIHGDAAMAGQGVVFETLNLSQLKGYATGGTIHVVINNQLGFTTNPDESRSGAYATDIAKAIVAPVWHVNGDDPEAVLRVTQLAFDFRQQFARDVVIDVVCYRKHGHNETDDPTYTQPLMYTKIKAHLSVYQQYAQRLVREKVLTQADVDARRKDYTAKLSEAYDLMKRNAEAYELQETRDVVAELPLGETAITPDEARELVTRLTAVPADFHLNPKLSGWMDKRRAVTAGGTMDWAMGEALAFASLVTEGTPVRLSGQDVGRGTFSQRHIELYDADNGRQHITMQHLSEDQAPFEVWDSSLSEFAVMGFEFGISLASPETLVIWEAQFGDFVNGAQIIIDQFLSSAETKWGQPSGLVLLLPHGYEGQGPEHSSARIERFLQLCAENNMIVGNCTTPAQYFHALRRQMRGGANGTPICKPLILFTPKSLLRSAKAVSTLDDVTNGSFKPVLDDHLTGVPDQVDRVLFCSGKVYYDVLTSREVRGAKNVAIVRMEQMYPFPQQEVQAILNKYPGAKEVYWVQEEPKNMGPWRFMLENFLPLMETNRRAIRYAGRPEYASPAAGTMKRHEMEQTELVNDAFAPRPVTRGPRRLKIVQKKK
ncbi:MAG: multifunctional oxoglutarate decarboxylase/oxoglutarate dehydrogenase thiamine pyrophosphate-binding subunit/dihydrolipoyllysine-residue succinyltransferase subunit [Bryobacteraceae bacterium]|nr:multifunctional oxoglutarate decarboxylase/oxoglutarate dehydrogenase thiamine pyrophosphate-binding subunit/dihydrolipoyllysine-residue succinyltransferase subunit [Bryobacteraceae bacterium]